MRKHKRPANHVEPAFVHDLVHKVLKQGENHGHELPARQSREHVKSTSSPGITAMSITTSAALVDALQTHAILEPAQLDEVARSLQSRFADARTGRRTAQARVAHWLPGQPSCSMGVVPFGAGAVSLAGTAWRGWHGAGFQGSASAHEPDRGIQRSFAGLLANPDSVLHFQREIRLAARLDHPNLVRAHDAAQVGKTHFLVMEYAEGIDLQNLVQQSGRLPLEQAADYIRQAALGLQHAAERGIVHRDIKPSNLQVTAQGTASRFLTWAWPGRRQLTANQEKGAR